MGGGGGVVARRGLRRGALSDAFSVAQLEEAAQEEDRLTVDTMYVEVDVVGRLRCGAGAAGAAGGAACAAVRARLAAAPPHASALLCWAGGAGPLRLVTRAEVPPLHELHLWFDEQLLALLDMPFLTLRNITDKKTYKCHHCDAEFEHPNPLKIHMFLSCRGFSRGAFWRACASKLCGAGGVLGAVDAAAAEALAAAWARARGAHVCVYCGKAYSRKYGLKIHIRTHTGYKPLRCRHCLRAFADPSNLNKHVRLHAARAVGAVGAAGQHACAVCLKPLARRRDVARHMRAHHPHHH